MSVKELTSSRLNFVWNSRKENHFLSLELSTQRRLERRWILFSKLENILIEDITAKAIDNWIIEKKMVFI